MAVKCQLVPNCDTSCISHIVCGATVTCRHFGKPILNPLAARYNIFFRTHSPSIKSYFPLKPVTLRVKKSFYRHCHAKLTDRRTFFNTQADPTICLGNPKPFLYHDACRNRHDKPYKEQHIFLVT